MKKWQGEEGGGVENESVVGLSSLVGFLGKVQITWENAWK